jgi:hypothetical protein
MKSATSYLQDLFDHNQPLLAAQGLLWTRAGDNFLAIDDLVGTRRQRLGIDGAWERLSAQLSAHDGDALISNELLATAAPRKRVALVTALQEYEVQVVVTARDLARVVPSQWQTSVRNRGTTRWRDFVRAVLDEPEGEVGAAFWRRHDVPAILERWGRHVPPEQMTLVTVPASGVPAADFGLRFAGVFGVDASGFEQPPYSNPSIGAHSAELLRRLNQRSGDLDWQHYKWAYKNALARVVLAERGPAEPPIALSDTELARLVQRAEAMTRQVADSGVRVVGDLGDLIPAAGALAQVVDPGQTTLEELYDTAVDGLLGMGGVVADLRIEQEALVFGVEDALSQIGDEAAEWDEFVASGLSGGEPKGAQMVTSKFLRWRLERLAAAGLTLTTADPPASRDGRRHTETPNLAN